MKREQLPDGEIAVLGLAKSGMAVSRLLLADGRRVYASDSVDSPATTTAAKTLNDLGADAVVGAHDLSRISRASLVVASPGIPPAAPPLKAAREAGVPVVSEVEIGLTFLSDSSV